MLREYYWFCLDHVRAYNRSWNYCAGMTPEEVETQIRADTIGWRPTWPMGVGMRYFRRLYEASTNDPLGMFNEAFTRRAERARRERTPPGRERTPVDKALATFGLERPVTLPRIKARYKELVKRHHPDANGGDKKAEEQLKLINEAYTILRKNVYA